MPASRGHRRRRRRRRNRRRRHQGLPAVGIERRAADAAPLQQRVKEMRQPRLEDLLQQLQRVGEDVVVGMREEMESHLDHVEKRVQKGTGRIRTRIVFSF